MDVLLANPRGFCAGVERAISIVERALAIHGAPIYVRHEVVHNKYVVEDLKSKGAVFVEPLAEVPPGSTVSFSAHGVSKAVRGEAAAIVEALEARCPATTGPKRDGICFATQRRQDAVKVMAPECGGVIVVGSRNSSNSNRLREVAGSRGIEAYMVDSAGQLKAEWVAGKRRVGVTAGASAPEVLVNELIARLKALGAGSVRQLKGVNESVVFTLPRELALRAAPR